MKIVFLYIRKENTCYREKEGEEVVVLVEMCRGVATSPPKPNVTINLRGGRGAVRDA